MHTTNPVLKSARKKILYIPAIKATTYGYRTMNFHCAKLWNDTFKKGIAIDGFGKNNVSLSQLHNKSHFKMTIKKHFLYNHLLYYKIYIVYYIVYQLFDAPLPFFFLPPPPFPSPFLHPPPIFYLFSS